MAIPAQLATHFLRPPLPQLGSKPVTSLYHPFSTRPFIRNARKGSIPVKASFEKLHQQKVANSTNVDMEHMVQFLYEDLPHLFDDQGIDRTAYDEFVKFRDPITKYDSIDGYLFNIALMEKIFKPHYQLHYAKQLRYYKTPDLETPKYQVLKRMANYEVRKYAPFKVVETVGDKLSGSIGFNNVACFIFGTTSKQEKIAMTTPVFTQKMYTDTSDVSIQIVLPDMRSLQAPVEDGSGILLKTVDRGIAAVTKFSGKATEDIVSEKARVLRSSLINDGLVPKPGCSFARYNDPGRTWSFTMRNEVLIWLEDFVMD